MKVSFSSYNKHPPLLFVAFSLSPRSRKRWSNNTKNYKGEKIASWHLLNVFFSSTAHISNPPLLWQHFPINRSSLRCPLRDHSTVYRHRRTPRKKSRDDVRRGTRTRSRGRECDTSLLTQTVLPFKGTLNPSFLPPESLIWAIMAPVNMCNIYLYMYTARKNITGKRNPTPITTYLTIYKVCTDVCRDALGLHDWSALPWTLFSTHIFFFNYP